MKSPKTKNTKRIFVYINIHAAFFINYPVLKKYMDNKIGYKNWTSFCNVAIPEVLQEDYSVLTENFFHGLSTQQYTMIMEGGTFINPMLYGLTTDFMMWNDIIHSEPDFFQEVVHIDIPFDIYERISDSNPAYKVSEEEYERATRNSIELVKSIKKTYYPSTTEIH